MNKPGAYRIGVDIGGTFTDIVDLGAVAHNTRRVYIE